MLRLPQTHSTSTRGFSLVEMLTTIAVLGVMTAIALMSISQINQNSKETRDRRNAQELAAVCAVAQAAGVEFVVSGDLPKTIENIVAGGTASEGAFAGKSFGMRGLQPADQETASKYLELADGNLNYKPNP
jgi:prepilin-type N-terminal cleavage/methylation domain-containing protein